MRWTSSIWLEKGLIWLKGNVLSFESIYKHRLAAKDERSLWGRSANRFRHSEPYWLSEDILGQSFGRTTFQNEVTLSPSRWVFRNPTLENLASNSASDEIDELTLVSDKDARSWSKCVARFVMYADHCRSSGTWVPCILDEALETLAGIEKRVWIVWVQVERFLMPEASSCMTAENIVSNE